MGWHYCLHKFASLIQGNSFRLVTVLTVCLLILSSALRSYKLETSLSSWIQKTARIESELDYLDGINSNYHDYLETTQHQNQQNHNHQQQQHQGSTNELVLQVAKNSGQNVLTVNSMKAHLEALAIATHVTVDLYDVSWSLKDICFTPTVPIFEFAGLKVDDIMNNLMPCVIKTPLDCFWDGSKLLGPDLPGLTLGPFGRNLQWTTLNPRLMIEKLMSAYSDSSYTNLLEWMDRMGISNGYQTRPCLEPSDPKCPLSAPNKQLLVLPSLSTTKNASNNGQQQQQNIASYMTGGCKGFAANLMHWHEEEIMGGLSRNKSGFVTHAEAIQSTILLMGDHDMYEYWKNMKKVLDINDWSVSKARNIISAWQKRFTEELQDYSVTKQQQQLVQTGITQNNVDDLVANSTLRSEFEFNIYSMTSKSQLEPIDETSLINSDNFIYSFIFMTLFTCLSFPRFKSSSAESKSQADDHLSQDNDDISKQRGGGHECCFALSRLKTILLALTTSTFVMLTFIASLGTSTFLNFPINMATAQILPPLALYYGFNQLNMIANLYSSKFSVLTGENGSSLLLLLCDSRKSISIIRACLAEITPVLLIESVSYVIALTVASLIPMQATRTFAYQAIICVLLMTISSFTLMPAIIHAFLIKSLCPKQKQQKDEETLSPSSSSIPTKFAVPTKSNRCNEYSTTKKNGQPDYEAVLLKQQTLTDDQLLSRIQEDLKYVRADLDSNPPTYSASELPQQQQQHINFSAQFDVNGLHTSFSIRSSTAAALSESTRNYRNNPAIVTSSTGDDNTKNLKTSSLSGEETIKLRHNLNGESIEKFDTQSTATITTTTTTNSLPALEDCDDGCDRSTRILRFYARLLTECKVLQLLICFGAILILAIVISFFPKVNYAIQLSSILDRQSIKYEPLLSHEKHFPIYNIFIVTKGNFDYPNNQRLLHEFYSAFEKIDGIIKLDNYHDINLYDATSNGLGGSNRRAKFWLFAFRDWLLNLQQKYDLDKNKSLITSEGWAQDVSDSTKLAYKLLAQTGRPDFPIDRSIVDTNRLVDSKGIINVKAFYYYLTAWVMSDSFTYAITEANIKPEFKSFNANLDDLKLEKARPIAYAQIPFILRLPDYQDNLKTITEVRRISQAYESVIPNFPTGIPFIFWDQFINLDLTFFGSLTIGILIMFVSVSVITSDLVISAITVIPITTTSLELYGLLGYLSIPFNNILAVLVIVTLGTGSIQTVYLTTYFKTKQGDLITRTKMALANRIGVVFTSLSLLFLCAFVFLNSKMDFMLGYAFLLIYLAILSTFNGLLVTPVLLSLFGSQYMGSANERDQLDRDLDDDDDDDVRHQDHRKNKNRFRTNKENQQLVDFAKSSRGTRIHVGQASSSSSNKTCHKKKRYNVRVQSNISLSTISEESQSRTESPELKIQISSRNLKK